MKPIYEFEGVDKGKVTEYALGRDERLVLHQQGHRVTYTVVSLTGAAVRLSAKSAEALRETLNSLLETPEPPYAPPKAPQGSPEQPTP